MESLFSQCVKTDSLTTFVVRVLLVAKKPYN